MSASPREFDPRQSARAVSRYGGCMRPGNTLGTALAVASLMALGACTTPPRGKAEGAPAPADHGQLARYHAGEARRLDAEAQQHEKLARSYAGLSLGANDGLWARHCARLAEKLRGAARESIAVAELHERAAAAEPR